MGGWTYFKNTFGVDWPLGCTQETNCAALEDNKKNVCPCTHKSKVKVRINSLYAFSL